MGTNNIDKNAPLAHLDNGGVISPRTLPTVAQPGDILVFETPGSGHQRFSGMNTEHTGIYIGNGFMMNAPESGEPVGIADASRDSRRIDVLRINGR